LAIFKEIKVDLDLYANVFGESALNDAVAIVLYKLKILGNFTIRTMQGFPNTPLSTSSFFGAIADFSIILMGSLAIGIVIALLAALVYFFEISLIFQVLKYSEIHKYENIEMSVLVLFAYLSYLVAEGLELSGSSLFNFQLEICNLFEVFFV
jgi:NhaP-type Na+/H+ or K+/H+ antiporter